MDAKPKALASGKLLQALEQFLAGRYANVIAPDPEHGSQNVECDEIPRDEERLLSLLSDSVARVVRQREIAVSLETAGHLDAAARAWAVLTTFQKTHMLLRRHIALFSA